jgi:K+-sensing histidine kinase KdpD
VGVLDMQSEHAGSLNKDILPAFEALAGQLAIAIQNATFLAETQQARAEIESQARRLTHTNWVDYMDAIHKPEETGFVFEQNKIAPMTQAEQSQLQININALTAPIEVTGESLGNLVVEMEGQSPISHTSELVNTVARQVGQQIESLRLLDSAERYRAEAEEASRRTTRDGWKNYMDTNTAKGLSYIYDMKEVRPHKQDEDQQSGGSTLSLPLKVHDETVGQLIVQGIEAGDNESRDLANAVAERLGAHIEGLRLSRQTEQALATTQKLAEREQALRQITSAVRGSTDPATILRSAARELGTLLGRKTIVRLTTTAEQSSQAHRPADLVGEAIANNGNESITPAELPNVDGGKK